MIRPKTKAGLGRIVENWALGVGGAGCPILGGPKFFSTYSNGFFFFFLFFICRGWGPPSHYMALPLIQSSFDKIIKGKFITKRNRLQDITYPIQNIDIMIIYFKKGLPLL